MKWGIWYQGEEGDHGWCMDDFSGSLNPVTHADINQAYIDLMIWSEWEPEDYIVKEMP